MGAGFREDGQDSDTLGRNIRSLIAMRQRAERQRTLQERLVDRITGFVGSMPFVWLHVALFGGWLLINSGVVPWIAPFDPFPFVMLAMWASVEAIFLSTFVLITQNRMGELADRRADLNLQISLLSEHEITRLITLTSAIAGKLDLAESREQGLEELKKDVAPEQVADELERAERDLEKE